MNCSASDSHGNTGNSASFTITVNVRRHHRPVFGTRPQPIRRSDFDLRAEAVTWANPTATDAEKWTAPCECHLHSGSGSTFPQRKPDVGPVHGERLKGNNSSTSFNVTVQDTTDPLISNVPGDILAEATSPSGRTVTFNANPTATDLGFVPVNCVPGRGRRSPSATRLSSVRRPMTRAVARVSRSR